jgi:hypothetical protein
MPRRFVGSLIKGTAILVAFGGVALAEGAVELPQRKAGLWELKTVMDEGGKAPRDEMLTICVEAEMERNTVRASIVEHKTSCTKYDVSRQGDVTKVDAACDFNGRHVDSVTEMSGDFQTAMLVKIESTTSGMEKNQSISVKRTITQNGKYLGESCGDLQPGEAQSPDGTKVMVQ